MASYPFNLIESIVDEVALEGLDGITLQALWIRLANRFHDKLPLPKPFMDQVWSICKKIKEFSFYKLNTPRDSLVIFDRYEFVHPDLGIILEPPNVPSDIYPHYPIQDLKAGVRGSCSTYYTRTDIKNDVKNASLDEVTEKYGLSLVIVASQLVRTRALMDVDVNPTLELTIMHYCFLERVGRARYHGEVTQGKLSLAALKEDPKSLFYHRKFLLQHKLITKQVHHQKSSGHCGSGSLLHLPRFYVERKPKVTYLAEQVLEILRSKENGVAEYDEIKKKLGIENSIKKLFKTSFFQKIVKTDICVPYRTLYPNAEPSEWRQKQDPSKEKKIRVVQVLYPDIDIADMWNKDEKDDDEDIIELDISNHKYNVPYLKQANAIIEANQFEGVSQAYLGKEMGLTKLQSRTFLRNMVKMRIIATYMNDMGRQRITKYVSKKFEKSSKMSKQFNKEMHKIKELTKRITSEKENKAGLQIENEVSSVNKQEDDQASQNPLSNKCVDQIDIDTNIVNEDKAKSKIKDIDAQYIRDSTTLQKKFYIANKIFHKYWSSKFRSRYKCTSSQSLLKTASKGDTKKQRTKAKISPMSIHKIANDAKATSFYNSIKTNLVTQKPIRTGDGVNEDTSFLEVVQNSEKKNISNITYRLLRRANMIIEAVKEHQVIDDTTKLMKMIYEEEDKEGYDVKIDKKSLIRLLQKLAKDNLVKNIKLTLSANGREKNLTFICDPNIDIDHTVIKSAVEQAKLKFCLLGSQKMKLSAKKMISDKQDKTDSKEKSQELGKTLSDVVTSPTVNYKYDAKAGKRYGLSPKFIRMQAMHVLLFYLVYDHPGVPNVPQQKHIDILRISGYDIDDDLVREFSTIYNTEVSWKMFVPPLPKHGGWPEGWALMCDVLLGLPLSLFVKVHNITFAIPELEHYLSHPIRKHYLVKDLPIAIRNTLLHARKYIYNIHDTVTRLAYIGLVQFGPQRLKDKDQVFIYMNRRTEIMDTVSSAPSYHKIEDKEYPKTKYYFDHTGDVEKYWYDMWTICVNTPLGGRLVVHGKDILLEDLNKKTAMIQAITARNPKETVELDTGAVPGDRKGAAGIDSAFFAHLKRNWNWSINYSMSQQVSKNRGKSSTGQRDLHMSKIQTKPVKYTEYAGLKKVSGPPAPIVNGNELRKQVYDHLNKLSDAGRKNEALPSHQTSKQKSFVRRVMPRKQSNRARLKYDEDDYRAMQRMHKLRVDWDPHEVNILLVCKVAMTYLSPNPRKQVVSFIAVRDVLRTYSYNSYNKTSRACQRRLLYMLRQSRTLNSVELGVEEIKQDPFITKRYSGIMDRLKSECVNSVEYEKRVTEVFKELIGYIVKKYYGITKIKRNKQTPMPRTAQEFNLFFKLVHPTKPQHQGFTKDVHTTSDIHSATINSVIHSSMGCGKDRRSWAYQLFRVYQQYPEALLRQAMSKIRTDQMVTVKKNHLSTIKKYGNYMPMTSSQYQLSINYVYKFQTKWPYDIFKESYNIFTRLLQWHSKQKDVISKQEGVFNGTEILPVSSGIVIVMHDLLACNQIDFDIEMPEQIIMLDWRYQNKNEAHFRAAQRYQDILTRLYRFKFENVDAQNAAEFLETEIKTNSDEEDTLTRKRPADEIDHFEQQIQKIPRRNEESEGKKSRKKSAKSQQNATVLKETSMRESVEHVEPKNSDTQKQNVEENCTNHLSRKRSIDAEEDSTDCKKPRLNSEDWSDIEEFEESCEDFESEKMKNISESLESMKELMNEQENEEVSSTQLNSLTDLTSISQRVSEIIRNVQSETRYLSPYCKVDTEFKRKSTRIDMLRIRKDINKFEVLDEKHHAHEYFVVNSFKMFYNLEPSSSITSTSSDEVVNFNGYLVDSQLIPLKIETINSVLAELNHFTTFPKTDISYTDYKDSMMAKKEIEIDWKHVDAVYNFVREKKEFGVCPQDLLDKFFDEQGTNLYKIVSLLTENRIFLRSGVTKPRFIHHCHVDPWLIHSYKIHRLEQESVVPFKDSIYATMSQGIAASTSVETDTKHNEENADENHETINAIPSTSSANNPETEGKEQDKAENNLDNRTNDRKENSETNEECSTHTRKRMHRQRTCLLPQRDVYKSAQQLDFTRAEEIKVVIKPWIRIDGVLNRKVLDRMLGAVLSYCMLHPGITMAKVQSRFVPALQPFQTRELVEMLIKLGCLESKLLKKTRVTLFSKPPTIKINKLTSDTVGWSAEDEIVLEPAVDGTLKFSVFLSTRMYSNDFIP